jgi:hypothetical protein
MLKASIMKERGGERKDMWSKEKERKKPNGSVDLEPDDDPPPPSCAISEVIEVMPSISCSL